MEQITTVLGETIGPWTVGKLLIALGILVGSFILRAILTSVIGARLVALAKKTETEADDMASQAFIFPLGLVLPVIGVYFAFRTLAAGTLDWPDWADKAFKAGMTLVIAWTVFRMIDALATWLHELAARTESRLDDQLIPLLRKSAKVFIAILVFILTAQNMGYSVSGLLAGLGIGGLAFALAAKDTLANLFGSVTILIDQPFHVGDWVTLTGADGVVEEIGLRSTRIRTFAKTVVSIPNQHMANATVENHSLMPKRRIKFTVGVTYDATGEQMRQAVARIEQYLQNNSDIDQEFMLVKFTTFNDSSLDIFVYCFTVTTDWAAHLTVRQEVNLAIAGIIEELDLEIAFPTQTIHVADDQDTTPAVST